MNIFNQTISIVLLLSFSTFLIAQENEEPNPFDYGKMWTFENPPKDWFKEAYGFDANDEWFDDVRMSSLKFASWCSASFVSPEGLIMTNHHCSRDVVTGLQQNGENFDKQGFYATTLEDERKSEGLFVEQLVKVAKITKEVEAYASENKVDKRVALEAIEAIYAKKEEWSNLRIQLVSYYSGGAYSLYGFKKYEDIRLVMIPELDLGFYGGDPDNFTYPRYNLDVTFWRAYDENGKPLNTSKHYLKFNREGAQEGEATFVIGNPGNTERYRSIDQLLWDRDYRYKQQLMFLNNRNDRLLTEYEIIKNNPAKEFEAQELLNNIANMSNSIKAISGIVEGMHNAELFGRKIAMEKYIQSKTEDVSPWSNLSTAYTKLEKHTWPIMLGGPNPMRGNMLLLWHEVAKYQELITRKADDVEIETSKSNIITLAKDLDSDEQKELFSLLLDEFQAGIYPGDNTLDILYNGKSKEEYINSVYENTRFTDAEKLDKLLSSTKKFPNLTDPILVASRLIVPKYKEASAAFQSSSAERKGYEQQIANAAFQVFGDDLPPDATFTLRISDGIVKGYDYNGTTAPYKTTYFGLYDRHYSFDQEFPWALPSRWQNPSLDLLKSPYNFVSTNDIIGGNSGSPMINKNKEVVGLIFDGNIESLPGNFIFDERYNRTVSVHSGGIMSALEYIYKADRLLSELQK